MYLTDKMLFASKWGWRCTSAQSPDILELSKAKQLSTEAPEPGFPRCRHRSCHLTKRFIAVPARLPSQHTAPNVFHNPSGK